VNGAPTTWTVRDCMIVCSGIPTGVLRTIRHYENFILELEWRHVYEGGNAGLFVYSDPLPVRGQPFTRSVENQIMDGNHGDVFAIQGATMVPDRPHPQGWMRSLPDEERARPFGEWNHYRVESRDGRLTLAVNGKVVSGGAESVPRRGYICLESEGSEVHFRNIRIKELPSTNLPAEEVAGLDEGFMSLYNGLDLAGWQVLDENNLWTADDWRLSFAGLSDASPHLLLTRQPVGDFTLIADWRFTESEAMPSEAGQAGLLIRGWQAQPVPIRPSGYSGYFEAHDAQQPALQLENADRDPGEWNRYEITVTGRTVTVRLNGTVVVDEVQAPEMPDEGPVGLLGGGRALQFANLYIKTNE
jgi:hypothetical protein